VHASVLHFCDMIDMRPLSFQGHFPWACSSERWKLSMGWIPTF
jgi:hypothetical protein